jgi:hypothetical protein
VVKLRKNEPTISRITAEQIIKHYPEVSESLAGQIGWSVLGLVELPYHAQKIQSPCSICKTRVIDGKIVALGENGRS